MEVLPGNLAFFFMMMIIPLLTIIGIVGNIGNIVNFNGSAGSDFDRARAKNDARNAGTISVKSEISPAFRRGRVRLSGNLHRRVGWNLYYAYARHFRHAVFSAYSGG